MVTIVVSSAMACSYIDVPAGIRRSREGSIRLRGGRVATLTRDELGYIQANRPDVAQHLVVCEPEQPKVKQPAPAPAPERETERKAQPVAASPKIKAPPKRGTKARR